jgi:salicylate hydroxylase
MAGRPHILIAGGGIGGIVAALALLERGLTVSVHEQAADPREVGAGVQIAPNGSRVLCALGLEAAMQAIATAPAGKVVRLFSTGQSWDLLKLGGGGSVTRYGAPYWMVHRGDFHRVLLDALAARHPGRLRLGARCLGFEQDGAGVTLRLEGGETVRGDALIGADGVHSRIRDGLFGRSPARFTGFVSWRGVIPMERLPERLRAPIGTNWMGPHGHVVTYPLRRGELMNFVTAIERDDWRVESWTEAGSVAELQRDFALWHPDVQEIAGCIETPYKWALLGREPLPRWSVGRVTLLGDAAHPTLPFMAQGANMAIEDGMVLARCFDAAADDVPAALARYDAARRERTARIVRAAEENVVRFHHPDLADPERAEALINREFHPATVAARYDWVLGYDALTVPL